MQCFVLYLEGVYRFDFHKTQAENMATQPKTDPHFVAGKMRQTSLMAGFARV